MSGVFDGAAVAIGKKKILVAIRPTIRKIVGLALTEFGFPIRQVMSGRVDGLATVMKRNTSCRHLQPFEGY